MKKNVLICTFCLLLNSLTFGQLENLISSIAESGSIIFTSEINNASKKKDVKGKKTFNSNEIIYGTIYMKQIFSRLKFNAGVDSESFSMTFKLIDDNNKKFIWDVPIDESKKSQKYLCFEFIPEQMNLDNPNHFNFINFIKNLETQKHEFEVSITQRELVTGKLILDLSNGKGKYQILLDQMKEKERLLEEEKEKERIAKEKEAARLAAEEQKLIDKYNASSDFINLTLTNNSNFNVSIYLETANKVTDSRITIRGKSSKELRCRPGETIYAGNKVIHTISQSSKGKEIDASPPDIKISYIATKWSGDDAWKSWNINTNIGTWTMSTKWSGDDAWKSWNINTNGPHWSVETQWSSDDAWKSWNFNTSEGKITIKTKWSGDDAWKSWNIYSKFGNLDVQTKWSGDDAWKSWNITSKYGQMTVNTKWSGDDAWKSWNISDNMKNAPPQIKMAAIFTCIIGGIRP